MSGQLRTTTTVGSPFDLRLALFGHGWIDLAPHTWDPTTGALSTAITLGERAADVTVVQRGAALQIRVQVSRASAEDRAAARAAVRRMLRLDEDLTALWTLCLSTPSRRWVAERGGGRLMRSPTVFEDLMKLLFTTNCSWAATRGMTRRLVDALGAPTPGGKKAFPSAARCAAEAPAFYRDVVRAGYRAQACAELATAAVEGAVEPLGDASLEADDVRRALLALRGFGPYAAGQALRLLGHYQDLALDSWCRSKLACKRGRAKPPADRTIEREYRRFGAWRGLVLWLDLTAEWHTDAPVSPLDAG